MAIPLFRARLGAGVRVTLFGLALVAVAIGCTRKEAPGPRAAVTESEKSEKPKATEKKVVLGLTDLTAVDRAGWDVEADPAPVSKWHFNLKATIPFNGEVVVPTTPSPFVAVGVPKAKDTYRVYDLRTMDAVGERVVVPAGSRPALSPDGKYLAAWRTGKQADVVEVWAAETGKSAFKRDFAADEFNLAHIELLSGDRLWIALLSKDLLWAARSGIGSQFWGLKDGKQLRPLIPKLSTEDSRALSPGGRYLLTTGEGVEVIWVSDLQSGKIVGKRRFQPKEAPKGAPAGLAFSPDGEEIAMLWRLAERKDDVWGRLVCWDFKTGKKLHDHPLRVEDLHSEVDALTQTSKRIVQFWPDRKGWMLFGYLLIDRESGAVLPVKIKELGLPRDEADMQDRRFLDADHVTEARDRAPRLVRVIALPKAEIERAVKEARR